MIDELISFETAKLAKEKGFDEKVYREYDKSGYLRCTSKSADVVLGPYDELLKSTEYPAPTQSLLQKWLREEHKLQIAINYCGDTYPTVEEDYDAYYPSVRNFINGNIVETYEEALEQGLQEALKLIK